MSGSVYDCLVIGFDKTEDKDITVMVVGRKDDKGLHIINAFIGQEAEDMYKQLTSFPFVYKDLKKEEDRENE